jgi:hypothetical protein
MKQAVKEAMLRLQLNWLVQQVRDMRAMQKAPRAIVRDGKLKTIERAVDRYVDGYASYMEV